MSRALVSTLAPFVSRSKKTVFGFCFTKMASYEISPGEENISIYRYRNDLFVM